MTFEEQIYATLIGTACGAVLGLIIAVIGFRINAKFKSKSELLNIINNLTCEFNLNQAIIVGRVTVINDYIGTIEDNDIFCFRQFKRYERIILDSLFVKGRLYDIFEPIEFADIYLILNIIDKYTEDYIDSVLQEKDSEKRIIFLNEINDEFTTIHEMLIELIISLDKKKIKTENASFFCCLHKYKNPPEDVPEGFQGVQGKPKN